MGAKAKFKPRSNTKGEQYSRQNQFRGKPSHSQFSISCYRCGDPNHKANDKCCPAKDATCRNCGKTGYFAQVCRSQPVRQISEQFDNTTTAHASDTDSTCTCSSHTPTCISHVQVLNTCHALIGNIMCQVFLNDNVPVNMVFDTGSAVSLLPAELFHKNCVQELLHPVPATVSFVTYLQESIPVNGVFETSVRFGDTVAQGRIYIVERGEPILGRDLISALQLILQDNMVKRIRPAANDTNHSSSSDADTMTADAFSRLPVREQVPVQVAQGRIYIVERGEPILGRDLISALQLILQDNMVKRIRPAANDTNHSSSSDADTMTADAFSRLPVREQVPVQDCDEEIVIQNVNALFASSVISKADLQRATAEDSTLTTIMTYVASGWASKNAIPVSVQPFYELRDELSVVDGCLMRGERCVIPAQLHNKLISAAHAAHQGIVRTKQRLRELFWWPAMDKAVEEAIATCDLCQTSDKVGKTRNTPLQPVRDIFFPTTFFSMAQNVNLLTE